MNPITESIPKSLISIAGMTLFERIISVLQNCAVDRIVVGVGWHGNLIRHHIAALRNSDNITITNVPDYSKGPLFTLKGISSYIDSEKPFLIIPADTITNETIVNTVISEHVYGATPRIMTIGVDKSAQNGATVHADDDHTLSGLNLSKSSSIIGRCAMVVATDFEFMRYCDLAMQSGENKVSSTINRMIAYNEPVRPAFVEGDWFDIDTISDLLPINRALLNHKKTHSANMIFVPAGDTIEISDRMNLAGEIAIDSGVKLIGPLVIQKESRIAASAIVGPYVSMGPNSSIGEECTISNSILLDSVKVPANRTLDSVIVHAEGIERG